MSMRERERKNIFEQFWNVMVLGKEESLFLSLSPYSD